MKNILSVGIFYSALLCSSYSSSSFAGVVDFSQCGANSSFAIVTQSEGPTYACGGLDTGVGNPINVLNGNKFEAVEDFKELPAFKGISFSRFYNSQSHANTPFGYGWYSSFDLKLYEQPDIIQIRLESGKRINFKKNRINLGNNQFVIRALPLNPSDGWIEKKVDGSGWVWHKTQSNQDYFFQYLGGKDPHLAHITKITALADIEKNDPTLNFSFAYDQQQHLVNVKNGQGQQLNFAYSTTKFGLPQIVLTTPLGQYFYFLDRNNNLAQVVYPDGRRFKYSYDPKFQGGDIHNLTAKSIFDRTTKKFKLLSQWQYDNQDRAFLSQHAGGVEKVTIQFDARTRQDMPANYAATKSVFKNIVTNSLGQKTAYSYQIDGTQFQLLESLGAGCASCGEVNKRYRFNAQGLVSYAADLDSKGSAIRAIDLKYNDLGEVIARTVSGVGVQPQTTHYEYESYQLKSSNVSNLGNPLLVQLNQRDVRRLKTEFRNSVVAGKQYRKSYAYDQDNRLISVKESGFSPLGDTLVRESKYGYDAQGRLAWEDGPLPNGKTNSPRDSDIRTFQYNLTGQLKQLNLPGHQGVQVLSFDKLERPSSIKVFDGQRTMLIDLSYVGTGLNVSKYIYHSANQKHIIENKFNAQGQLISTQNGLQQTDFIYDLMGRLIEKRNIQGLNLQKKYNTENLVTSETLVDQDGKLVHQTMNKFNFSSDNVSTEVSDALGLLQKTSQTGLISTRKDALNRVFIQHADGLGRTIALQIENKSNQLIHSTLSSFNQGHATQSSAGLQQNKWMDDFGRTVVTQSPAIGIKLYRFNEIDLPTEIIDEKGFIQKNKYDYAHNLVESSLKNPKTQEEIITQKTEFEGSKPIRQISQDEVQQWQYAQDGKLLRHTTAQLDTSSNKKNVQPINFISQTQQLNQIADILSGKSKQQDHNLSINSWSEDYEYDENGLLSKEIRRDLTIQYDRDNLGQVTALQLTKNGEKASVDQIQWSGSGQLAHYRLSSGQQLWRNYDSRGRLTEQRWYSPTSQSWWGNFVHKVKYQWLNQNLPKTAIQTANYVYDQADRLIYSNESGRQFYQYDDQDQLLAVWKSDSQHKLSHSWYPAQVYTYDFQGNRRLQWQKANKQQLEAINFYRYGENADASVQLLGVSRHQISKGNIQTGQLSRIASYAQTGQPHAWWQAESEVNTVLDYVPSANSGAPLWDISSNVWKGINDQNRNISIDQQFNQQGLISKRSVVFNSKNQQHEFSQRNGYVNGIRMWEQQRLRMPTEKYSDIHTPELNDVIVDRDYVMLAGLPVMQFSQISTQKQNEQLDIASASFNAVQFNRIGAPVKVFDKNNTVRWQTDYSAFGERLNTVSTHNDEAQLIRVNQNLPLSQSIDDLRYAISVRLPGQNEDPITGLYDNGYRQYDPVVGRYLTPDPMGTIDGLNPYLYVGNNPLNKVDPYGLYQTDMHYYMTYFLAITAGIDSDNARRIALAAQFVDTNDNTSPYDDEAGAGISLVKNFSSERLEYYHFTNNRFAYTQPLQGMELGSWDLEKPKDMSDNDYLKWRLTSNLNNIPQLKALTRNYNRAAQCGNLNLSMQFFGEYLHAFEDTFAHRDQDNDPFGVNAGAGHGTHGSHPDYTYNHYGKFELPTNLVGYGYWAVNETRSIVEQEQVYKKLVEYRNTVLKIPTSEVKAVPWYELKNYLSIYNAIPENLNHEAEVGSLDSIDEKITYLQALLNGSPISQNIYTYDYVTKENKIVQTHPIKTNWGYKPKQGGDFELIEYVKKNENRLFDKTRNPVSGYIAGKHGYSIPQAITNRIEVFKTLNKTDKEKYTNLVWDTSVQKYKSKDGESETTQSAVQYYRLSTKSIFNLQSSPFTITGTPPAPR